MTTDIELIEKYAREMFALTGRWGIFLDYEYNNSQEKYINPVCCSVAFYDAAHDCYTVHEYWLLNNPSNQQALVALLCTLRDMNHVMIAYSVGAEGRATHSLEGHPDIKQWEWVDLYLEWLQAKNKNNDMLYGKYIHQSGFKCKSVPPSFDPAKNVGKDNTPINNSLAACVYKLFGDCIDTDHKDRMRDLILECKPEYPEDEQIQIMTYCTSDIKYLAQIWHTLTLHLKKKIKQPVARIFGYQLYRGDFGASGALMETVGTPVNVPRLRNLRNNHDQAVDTILTELVTNHYPFYIKERKNKLDWEGQWVAKAASFEAFVTLQGMIKTWPRVYNKEKKKFTEALAQDNATLKKFDNIPEIKAYRYAKKNLKQLGWLRAPHTAKQIKAGDFFDSIGKDGRIRTFLGLYGTQTARNAPKAKRFVLAMSSWLRCTIEPPEGYVIVAIDYSSQEFGIAAVRAKDRNMIEAYVSGDPYIFFAKKYKSIPMDANRAWVKNPAMAPEAEQAAYKKHKSARTLAKGVVLGLQFGLGYKNLAVQLTANTGTVITEEQALELVNFHKQLFSKYWDWQEVEYAKYLDKGYLQLSNGWCLLGDNDNSLSVKNFGVQGYGAAMMQDAVLMMHRDYKIDVITPLHDATYSLIKEDEVDAWVKCLEYCMTQGVVKTLGDKLHIRLDTDIHRRGEEWIEEKGEADYKMLSKYLEELPTKEQQVVNRKSELMRIL